MSSAPTCLASARRLPLDAHLGPVPCCSPCRFHGLQPGKRPARHAQRMSALCHHCRCEARGKHCCHAMRHPHRHNSLRVDPLYGECAWSRVRLVTCAAAMSSRAELRASGVLSLTRVPAARSSCRASCRMIASGGPRDAATAVSARPAWPRTCHAPHQSRLSVFAEAIQEQCSHPTPWRPPAVPLRHSRLSTSYLGVLVGDIWQQHRQRLR
jgi:hypothetical protein